MLDGTFKEWPADTKTPRTGRIKCGTESNGGFKNITISNCVFEGCRGLALESVDGALLEDIAITNITMRELTIRLRTVRSTPKNSMAQLAIFIGKRGVSIESDFIRCGLNATRLSRALQSEHRRRCRLMSLLMRTISCSAANRSSSGKLRSIILLRASYLSRHSLARLLSEAHRNCGIVDLQRRSI
jgi:hypothetical protein